MTDKFYKGYNLYMNKSPSLVCICFLQKLWQHCTQWHNTNIVYMYVSYLDTSDFDICSNKLNRYDLKRCQLFRLKSATFKKVWPEIANEVLLSMLKSNSEENETFINKDCLENTYRKNIHIKHNFESNDFAAKIKYNKKTLLWHHLFCKIESRKSLFVLQPSNKLHVAVQWIFTFKILDGYMWYTWLLQITQLNTT